MDERPVELICMEDEESITIQMSKFDRKKFGPGETVKGNGDIHYLYEDTIMEGKKFYVTKLPGHPIHY